MDDSTRYILLGLGIPGVMGLVVGVMGALGVRAPVARSGAARVVESVIVACVLAALAGAIMLSTYGVHGGISVPPVSSDDRLRFVPGAIFAVALAGVIARLVLLGRKESGAHPPDRLVAVVTAMLGAAVGVAISLGPTSLNAARLIATGVLAVWAGLACTFLIRFQEKSLRVRGNVILVGLVAGVGAGLLGTGCQTLGEYAFGDAAIGAGLAVGALVLCGPVRPFTIAIFTSFVATLLACGVCLSDTPWWVVGVLGAVVPVAYAVDVVASRRLRPRVAAAVTIVVAAAIAIGAVAPGIKSLVDFMNGTASKQQEE
jgi:hypothetical protein